MGRLRQGLLLLIMVHLTLGSVTIYRKVGDSFSQEKSLSPGYITCSEGDMGKTDKKRPEAVDITEIENMFAEHGNHSVWTVYKIGEVKVEEDDLPKCPLCSFHSIKCLENKNSLANVCSRRSVYKGPLSTANCEKHIVSFKTHSGSVNEKSSSKRTKREEVFDAENYIHIPIGGKRGKHMKTASRQLRQTHLCGMPEPMDTAAVFCRLYPKSVKCIQRCAFGYTLESGISQKLECDTRVGVWKPTGFKECKPFVDCTVSLKSSGSLTCNSNSEVDPPVCQITCLHYEDNDEVPEESYTCAINGEWDPPLPFCVAAGSGLTLTTAPAVRLHDRDMAVDDTSF